MVAQPIALFDFDGTMTRGDTLLPFLIFCRGMICTSLCLARELPSLAAFCLGLKSRQQAKEGILRGTLGGISLEEIRCKGEQFASGVLEKRIKSSALKRLRWHQEMGHHTALVSANLEVYLQPLGYSMGFDAVLASRLSVDGWGGVTGQLFGLSCWGPEKVRRLHQLWGSDFERRHLIYAYGDSRGDKEMLALANFPYYRSI